MHCSLVIWQLKNYSDKGNLSMVTETENVVRNVNQFVNELGKRKLKLISKFWPELRLDLSYTCKN